jgi:hypothetical protein
MSSLKLFFYFLKALRHNFFQLWSDDTSSSPAVDSTETKPEVAIPSGARKG